MAKPTDRPKGRSRRPKSLSGDALVPKDPITGRAVEGDGAPAKRIALTVRLEKADWLRLKTLAARLSVEHNRPIAMHTLVHAAIMRALIERGAGLDLAQETLVEAEGRTPPPAGDGVSGD